MGIIKKIIGGGLGFTSEAIHAARSRSGEPASRGDEKVEDDDKDEEDKDDDEDEENENESAEEGFAHDEAAWELDEMVERVAPPSYEEAAVSSGSDSEETKLKKQEEMLQRLLRLAGPVPVPLQASLPCPVIIPQRRPRQKDRGFVRAYAPVLDDVGVSQEVFLQFLTDWDVARRASPWIDVVYVAAGVVGFVPEAATQIVSIVVQVVAGTAKELQSRQRGNTFLDRVNQELFMPRGLYAMVMAFKDDVSGQQRGLLSNLSKRIGQTIFSAERLDINQTAAKYSKPADPEMSRLRRGLKDFRLTSGETHGEIELPEAAPLVFPELDRAAVRDLNQGEQEEKSMREKWSSAGSWVQDYLDRRAQAFYEAEHQGSSLSTTAEQRAPMKSRFNDPNHPANSGSLIALLTGGAVAPSRRRRAAKQERRAARREERDARRVARGRAPRGPRVPRGKKQGLIRKILTQDVLYLLVVNLPTDEQVATSVEQLEEMMGKTEY